MNPGSHSMYHEKVLETSTMDLSFVRDVCGFVTLSLSHLTSLSISQQTAVLRKQRHLKLVKL